jgi:trehalose 6-phosphate phosphatase
MPHLFQPAGEAALAAVLRRGPLLGFDFDGTLAPIVTTPAQARISRSVSDKLRRLSARLPVAVVSGRSIADLGTRLDFTPHYVVGNHGAEFSAEDAARDSTRLDDARRLLAAHGEALARWGVVLEDKGLSLALHYRLSRSREQACEAIRQALRPIEGEYRTFAGKMVENIVPADATDKGGAMHALARHCGASCAFFIGDDVNDEAVFASAPPDWLTVRVGRDDPDSRARFFLDGTAEVALLLDRMLVHLGA